MFPKRDRKSHKGENGKVLVVGGSELYTGAPALSALSALRSGTDLAYIASVERPADIVASFSPDFITIKLEGKFFRKEHLSEISPFLKKSDSVVIGPGLSDALKTREGVVQFVEKCNKPMVIDADALKAVGEKPDIIKSKKTVLTPHRGEFKALTENEPTPENVRDFAAKLSPDHDSVVLVKGPVDIISNGLEVKKNKAGNPGMTVGGTGDVLSGLIAGLISQGKEPFEAAVKAAEVNSEAGDLCEHEKEYGFTASDLAEKIPKAMH